MVVSGAMTVFTSLLVSLSNPSIDNTPYIQRGTEVPNPSRETKLSGANENREILIFRVQLTTSRIDNLTRLIHTLLNVMNIHDIISFFSCWGYISQAVLLGINVNIIRTAVSFVRFPRITEIELQNRVL